MEIRQLLHFLAAVEHGSFHKAAEALNVSQPALTKSIRRLETTLGLTLFERHTRGISPTPYGYALASHGALIATDLRHAVQVVKDMQRAVLGTIRIGAGPSMGVALLPAVTSALLTQQPGIRLQVRNGLNDTLLAALQRGELDFAITSMPGGSSLSAVLHHERLYNDTVVIVAARRHPLARRTVSAEALLPFNWAMPRQNVLTRSRLEEFFMVRNLPLPTVSAETDSILYLQEVIARTHLLSYVPATLVAERTLTRLKVPGSVWHRPVSVSYRRRAALLPAHQLFLALLRETAHNVFREPAAAHGAARSGGEA
jgi:DNA-binding transcriptional LysR family regulator